MRITCRSNVNIAKDFLNIKDPGIDILNYTLAIDVTNVFIARLHLAEGSFLYILLYYTYSH